MAAALDKSDVIDEIVAAGAKAVAVEGDISQRSTADELVATADGLGGLAIVVNNAGITRDRMLFNMSDEDWDAVIAVHLRGHFLLTRNAATYWRAKAKEGADPRRQQDGGSTAASSTRRRRPGWPALSARPTTVRPRPASCADADRRARARALRRAGERDRPARPHRDDGRRVRRGAGTRRGSDRPPFSRARRLARSLPRVAGIRWRQRSGVHRVRPDGYAAGGADRRAAVHRERRCVGARRAERNAARVLC